MIHPNSICFRSFVDANMMKKKRQRVLNQLGGFSQQGAVSSVQGKDLNVAHDQIIENRPSVVASRANAFTHRCTEA